jgi:arsenate reductase (glutaredoxin)
MMLLKKILFKINNLNMNEAFMQPVTVFHNPDCGTSRNVLAFIRDAGVEPIVVEYLKTPLNASELKALIAKMNVPVRSVLRQKGTPYEELGLNDPTLTDDELIQAMVKEPILMNRPIVVTPKAAKLCRPSESVIDFLK